jgi:hypothetical protein
MKRLVSLAAAIALCSIPAVAAERLTDRDVKTLVEQIEGDRDKFEGALDDDLKRTVMRSSTGEVDVKKVLEDFQQSVGRLKDRLKPEYAGSTEAATVLQQATRIDAYVRQQPTSFKGASEWNKLSGDLKALAGAYGADFPLAENATVRRISDREVASSADAIAQSADRLKKAIDADLKMDTTVSAQARQAAVADAGQLGKDAKALRDRVKDGKPSSVELERVQTSAAKLKTFLDGKTLPTATSVWGDVTAPRATLAQAYGKSER